MNNKEASINKVDELVNRAQLAINDWQCSGDDDYLHKAAACLKAAAEADAEEILATFCKNPF